MKRKWLTILLCILTGLCAFSVLLYIGFSDHSLTQSPGQVHTLRSTEGFLRLHNGEYTPCAPEELVECASGICTLAMNVYPERLQTDMLFFGNNRQCVTVTADGETIYDLGSGPRTTRLSADCYCAIMLPRLGHSYRLVVTFSNLDGQCRVPTFYFGTVSDVLIHLFRMDVVTFLALPLWAILILCLVVLAIYLSRRKIRELRIITLATFLFCTAVWSFADMAVLCLVPISPELSSAVSHYMLMLMSIPVLFFAKQSCANRPPRLARALLYLLLANILGQSLLYVLNVLNLNQMLFASHICLFLTLVFGLISMVLDYRTQPTASGKLQILAFSVSLTLGIGTAITYWVGPGVSYRSFFQLTIMAFLAFLVYAVVYSAAHRNYLNRLRDAELRTYKELSSIDSLTGMNNRRAFEQKLEAIQSDTKSDGSACLVFMDLNGLKYTNDKQGHLAGDELIIAAAKCIRSVFDPVGTCYRVGGDEFVAIADKPNVDIFSCYDKMDRYIADYNRTAQVPLSIARGCSTLLDPMGHRRSVSDWKMEADKSMYADKVKSHYLYARGSAEDYREIISSFASAVDAKDSYTADHSGRVGVLSDRICRMLGLSESSAAQIHTAACLHDIGKIGIPDSVLSKSDTLTPEEWAIMQSHTTIGENIVKHTKAFYDVSQIIRHHHERFDGKGYPDGISGSEIPLGARIIAIADSIDAMTSDRSYRNSRTIAYCRQQIRDNLGKMYDPAIGAIVLEHWGEIEEIILMDPKLTLLQI